MALRKHQSEFIEYCRAIRRGSSVSSKVLVHVTPGGGKSRLPGILETELMPEIIGAAIWVVPRSFLKIQALDSINNHKNFQVECYQSISKIKKPSVDYAVFLDEAHHLLLDGTWHREIAPIIESAKIVVLMSGTIERGDRKKIAFFDYAKRRNQWGIDLSNTHYIGYSIEDALLEGAIREISFQQFDGETTWADAVGNVYSGLISDDASSRSIHTAINTQFGERLLQLSIAHWREKTQSWGGQLLVIAPTIAVAKKYEKYIARLIRKTGERAIIATKDNKDAHKRILIFKNGGADILITVGMAYEGLDVPKITHVCCLTHIRSAPWLLQCLSRCNRRISDQDRFGYVFAPSDPLFEAAKQYLTQSQTGSAKLDSVGKGEYKPQFRFDWAPVKSNIILVSNLSTREKYDIQKLRKQFLDSGLNIAEFCRRNNISKTIGHKYFRGLGPIRKINWAIHQQEFDRLYQLDSQLTLKKYANIVGLKYGPLKANLKAPIKKQPNWEQLQLELNELKITIKAFAELKNINYDRCKDNLRPVLTKIDRGDIVLKWFESKKLGTSLLSFAQNNGITPNQLRKAITRWNSKNKCAQKTRK